MKRLLLFASTLLVAAGAQAQFTGFSVELVQEHDGSIPSLNGYTTYRVYAECTSSTDVVSALFGDAATPLSLSSPTGFWQSSVGSDFGSSINPGLFGAIPELEYDSWLTIGSESSTGAGSGISQVGMTAALNSFNTGGDLNLNTANGGSWFVTFGNANAIAGDDLKVLVAQVTVDGDFNGSFNIQMFNGGVQANEEITEASCFSSNAAAVFGCTDPEATNYVEGADTQCGTCTYPCSLTLNQNTVTTPSCFGENDGGFTLTQSGAQLGILYSSPTNPVPFLANASFINLAAGSYTINAIDGAGCETNIVVEITEPEALTVTASVSDPISCNGESDGVISGSAMGGTGAYTFSTSSTFATTSDELMFDGLGAGLYTVYVQDENGCTASTTPMNLNNPMALSVGITGSSAASCADTEDGQIVVQSIGGSGTASGMSYSVDGENFAPGNIIHVGGGTYTVYVMDVNGCIGQSNNTVTIAAPDAIVIDLTTQAVLCTGDQNGVIEADVTGGSGSFSYIFGGDTLTAMIFENLAAGTYELGILDSDGCTASASATVDAAEPINLNISVSNVTCNGDGDGSLEVAASGGTDVFEYSLDNVVFGTSPSFNNLDPGVYNIYTMDSNGCVANDQVTITEPDALAVTGAVTTETADGAADGAIDIDVTGGNGGYEFDWSGPAGYSAASEDIDGLSAGDYSVTITDANGCEVSETFGVAVGISELTGEMVFTVFPNPSAGQFNVEFMTSGDARWSYEVVDLGGRRMTSGQWNGQSNGSVEILDLTSVANGAYFLNATNGQDAVSVRLMVSK